MKTKTLFTRARESDITILKEDPAKLLETKNGETVLHWLVTRGRTSSNLDTIKELLAHPLITEAKMKLKITSGYETIGLKRYIRHFEGYTSDKDFSNIIVEDITPLHLLAFQGIKEILDHPLVGIVKDSMGNTPLHILARSCQGKSTGGHNKNPLWKLLFKHPDFHKTRNNENKTPLEILRIKHHPIKIGMLRKILTFVPSQYEDSLRVTEAMWKEIINTPNSIKYILED